MRITASLAVLLLSSTAQAQTFSYQENANVLDPTAIYSTGPTAFSALFGSPDIIDAHFTISNYANVEFQTSLSDSSLFRIMDQSDLPWHLVVLHSKVGQFDETALLTPAHQYWVYSTADIGSTTAFTATILNAVPEPASIILACMAAAYLAFLAAGRSRRRVECRVRK